MDDGKDRIGGNEFDLTPTAALLIRMSFVLVEDTEPANERRNQGDIHEQVFVKSVADVFSRACPHIHSTSSQQERHYSTCGAGLSHHSEIAKRLSPLERGPVLERPLPPCHRLAFRLSCIIVRSVYL